MKNRQQTRKTYCERINRILQYINNNLDQKLDLNELANLSHYSPFHFHRIMRAYLGESLGSYIIRIRMEAAAHLLRMTALSVSEIAFKTGYDMPSSFNKAFRKRFGVSPSRFRSDRNINYSFEYKKQNQSIMKNLTPEPRMEILKEIRVIYATAIGRYGDENTEKAWRQVCDFAAKNGLFVQGLQMIGVSYDDPDVTDPEKCRYEACITVNETISPEGKVGVKTLNGGEYAIFKLTGPYSLLKPSYDYIFGKWIPENNIALREYPCFEKYLNDPHSTAPEKLETEIYIPVE